MLPLAAVAAPRPRNPDALGTARVLALDAASTPRLGRKQFPVTLAFTAKELLLTFDDGPWPITTLRELKRRGYHIVHIVPAGGIGVMN